MEKEENSFFEKLIIPIVLLLTIGLAFLLVSKRKVITLLTGLTVSNGSSVAIGSIVLIGAIVIAVLLFYKYRK